MLHAFTIKTKLKVLAGFVIFVLSILTLNALLDIKDELMNAKKTMLKTQIDTAYSLMEYYAKEASAGNLSDEQAREAAKMAIKELRYNTEEYFFIIDTDIRGVMHPIKPKLDGSDLGDIKDPDGKALFVEFVKIAKDSGAGYVDYKWSKPGSETPLQKLSYVRLYSQWGWIIGSGVYVDDVEEEFYSIAVQMGIEAAVISLILIVLIMALSRSILTKLTIMQETAQ